MKIITAAITAAAAVTLPFSTSAHEGDGHALLPDLYVEEGTYMYEYVHDNVCMGVPLREGGRINVVGTFEVAVGINVGSTVMTLMPCIPTACPEGYFLVSSNACTAIDPYVNTPTFIFSPVYDTATGEVIEEEEVTIDVGPLVEPSIAQLSN